MDSRAQTLEAIQTYIDNQRALLQRTQSDIEKLWKLREEAIARPEEYLQNNKTNVSSFGLTDISECAPSVPKNIDWSLFASLDPTPLLSLTHHLSQSGPKQGPSKTQQSELSPLQQLVKNTRVSILDPVLIIPPIADLCAASEVNGVEVDTSGKGKKSMGKKQGPLRMRTRASTAQAGSGSTSISINRRPTRPKKITVATTGLSLTTRSRASTQTPIDTPATSLDSFVSWTPPPSASAPSFATQTKHMTTRRSRPKRGESMLASRSNIPPTPSTNTSFNRMEVDLSQATVHKPLTIRIPKRPRPPSPTPLTSSKTSPPILSTGIAENDDGGGGRKGKPETYKQAWSVSEQHLLERLLDEIPEGEKNRWLKISLAMQGKRTPRQVASRVQKYFEKLKRFGVGVNEESVPSQ